MNAFFLIFRGLRWSAICLLWPRLRLNWCALTRTILRRCRSVKSDRSLLLPRLDLISRPPWQAAHLFNFFPDQIHTLVEILHDLSVFKEGFVTVSVVVFSREVF